MSGAFRFDPAVRGAALAGCEAAIALFFPGVPEITASDLMARMATPAAHTLLLDVRAAAEHGVGRIPGARHTDPGATIAEALSARELAGAAMIVCACSVGLRSGRLARALLDHGVPPGRVANLRGGLFRWARLGLPMVDDNGPTLAVHPFDARWGRLLDR